VVAFKIMSSVPLAPLSAQSSSAQSSWDRDVIKLCYLGELIESKVAHEISLTGHRMTWLVVSESFLFGAFAAVLTYSANAVAATANAVASQPGVQVSQTATTLLILLPALGMLLVLFVLPSLWAARAVMMELLTARASIETKLQDLTFKNLPILGSGESRGKLKWTSTCGDVSLLGVPVLLFFAWGAVFYARMQLTPLNFGPP
jgi:hypothetical protein